MDGHRGPRGDRSERWSDFGAVAALVFCAIQGCIRGTKQSFHIQRIATIAHSDAKARSEAYFSHLCWNRLRFDYLPDSFRDSGRAQGIRAGQDNQKLFTTAASYGVVWPDRRHHPIR